MLGSASQITGSIGIMATECNRTTEIELVVKFGISIMKQIKQASVNESSLMPAISGNCFQSVMADVGAEGKKSGGDTVKIC